MGDSATVLSVIFGYLALCLVLGVLPGRRASETTTGYVAGDRSLGLVMLYFITGASVFSAFAFLGGPGWAYSRGVAVLYILGYGVFGLLPFYFLGPRAARVGRRYGFVTQAEMVAARFQMPAIAGVMALVSVAAFVPYLALQMKGAGYVLSVVTHGEIPEWLGAAGVYGVVLVYLLASGVLGVGWTNTFQGIFMMVLAWALGLWVPYQLYGGVGAMFTEIAAQRPELLDPPGLSASGAPWNWGEYSTAVIVSTIGFSCWPHLFMRAFSARDDRTIRRTVVLYPTFQIFLIPIFLIGFAGVLFEGSSPEKADQILPHLLMNMPEVPALLVGLFCAGALAASMSSGDAMAHAAASIAVRDGMVVAGKKRTTPVAERNMIRWLLVVVIVSSYLVAMAYRGSLVTLLLASYGGIVQFAPVLVVTLYTRRVTGPGVLAGLVVGTVVTVAFTVMPGWRPWAIHAGVYGLVMNLAALALVSARGSGVGGDDEFLAVAGGDIETEELSVRGDSVGG